MASRKHKAFKQSHLDARFATPESTLTVPNDTTENFKLSNKTLKMSNLENYKHLSSHILRQDLKILRVRWHHPSTGLDF